jgi:hypothetical protein
MSVLSASEKAVGVLELSMGLFKQHVRENGFWLDDFNNRFDQRYFNADGYPTEKARWHGRELKDPLPPGFVFASPEEQARRARATLSAPLRPMALPLSEAKGYYLSKVEAILNIFCPNLPSTRHQEFEAMLTAGLATACQNYLDETFPAHDTYREEFSRIRGQCDAVLIIAWFWAIDPVFRLPNLIDEFILVGSQLVLRNMGALPAQAAVTHRY